MGGWGSTVRPSDSRQEESWPSSCWEGAARHCLRHWARPAGRSGRGPVSPEVGGSYPARQAVPSQQCTDGDGHGDAQVGTCCASRCTPCGTSGCALLLLQRLVVRACGAAECGVQRVVYDGRSARHLEALWESWVVLSGPGKYPVELSGARCWATSPCLVLMHTVRRCLYCAAYAACW
jgi:hypothetical protein